VNLLSKYVRDEWQLFMALVCGIIPIGFIPLFNVFYQLLSISIIIGLTIGMTLPLLVPLLARSVSAGDQGLAAGLRTTANRSASFVVPIIFGLVIQGVGMRLSFGIIAFILLAPMV